MQGKFWIYIYRFLLTLCCLLVISNAKAIYHSTENIYASGFVNGTNENYEVNSDSSTIVILNRIPVKIFQAKKVLYFANSQQLDSSVNIQNLIHNTKTFTLELLVLNQHSIFKTLSPHNRINNIPKLTWDHIVISYDGYKERRFINGKLILEENKSRFRPNIESIGLTIALGLSDFSGYISNVKFVNYAYDNVAVAKAFAMANHSDFLYALESADYDIGPISELVGYDGFSKAITSACKGCEVTVQKQRMSFKVNSLVSKDLISLLRSSLWSLTMEYLHNGKWSQVFIDKNGNSTCIYIDGLISDKVLTDYLVIRESEIKFSFKNMHNLRIYKRDSVNAKDLYEEFKARISLDLVNKNVVVQTPPHKINATNLFVALENSDSNLQYKFSMGFSSSSWLDEPYYLFDVYNGHINLDVQLRDIYGNVSKKNSILIQYPKLSLWSDYDDLDWVLGDTIHSASIWKHSINRYLSDDENISVSKGFQGWMLGSKRNSFLSQTVKEPYLYNFIDKDFTIELKVEDISGKLTNSLIDNEVGIIVQAVDHGNEYITNSINTVYNLGNSASYYHHDAIVKKSNNLGLQFHKYLQIQKSGHYFYLRTSRDGNKWENLLSNPVKQTHWDKSILKLGIFQFTNSNEYKYGLLSNIKIWLVESSN